jgi:lipopolysaccharide heptosyltransferase I
MENFLIIRTSSLGDIIHTLPALAALRKGFPLAKIAWAVGQKGKEILDFVPSLDATIVVGSPGWRRKIRQADQTVLDFQGLLKSGFIAWLSRSRKRIGFGRKNLKEPLASVFYTDRLEEVSETAHVIRKNLKLLRLVGVVADQFEFPLVIPPEIRASVRQKIESRAGRKLVLLNVGAAWPTKRWPAENWIAVLKKLGSADIAPLLLWGTPEEEKTARDIHRATGVTMVPFLTVKEILALVAEAAVLVSGDTFALQAACALSVPVVGIFGPTNPARNGPFLARDKTAYHEIDCGLCYRRSCDTLKCMKLVKSEDVVPLIQSALEDNA